MYKRKHFKKFNEMPKGWNFDTTWGSPLGGYVPISNGKSILNGGEKGLLKIPKQEAKKNPPLSESEPKIATEEPRTETHKEFYQYAKKMNDLARLKLKEQIINDLTTDIMICQIEGWDYQEYIKDLKQTIDSLSKSICSWKKTVRPNKQPDMFAD